MAKSGSNLLAIDNGSRLKPVVLAFEALFGSN